MLWGKLIGVRWGTRSEVERYRLLMRIFERPEDDLRTVSREASGPRTQMALTPSGIVRVGNAQAIASDVACSAVELLAGIGGQQIRECGRWDFSPRLGSRPLPARTSQVTAYGSCLPVGQDAISRYGCDTSDGSGAEGDEMSDKPPG